MVVSNDSGGAVSKDDPVYISNVFGFADHDAAEDADVSVSIAQEEREVLLPAKVGGWAIGDEVFHDGTVFDDVAAADPWDVPVGVCSRAVSDAGGIGWMIVIPGAFERTDTP
jgi:hypothetical protein